MNSRAHCVHFPFFTPFTGFALRLLWQLEAMLHSNDIVVLSIVVLLEELVLAIISPSEASLFVLFFTAFKYPEETFGVRPCEINVAILVPPPRPEIFSSFDIFIETWQILPLHS